MSLRVPARHSARLVSCARHLSRPQLSINHAVPRQSQVQSRRYASDFSRIPSMIKNGWRSQTSKNPILFPFAVGSVFLVLALGAYTLRSTLAKDSALDMYPEPVKRKLRRAQFYTNVRPDSGQAVHAFLQAIGHAKAEGMDPLSDEVLGIYIGFAHCVEKFGSEETAIKILEEQRLDCMNWISEHGAVAGNATKRRAVLYKAVQMATKIAELYTAPHILNRDESERYLTWAVEISLKEAQEAAQKGLPPLLDADQQGAQLEQLAHHYEAGDNFVFASQLFLRALSIKPKHDCHSVILMNNLAASIAQQPPVAERGQPPPSLADLRDSGRTWLKQALALSNQLKPPDRTEECDRGCAVAIHNLGEFAEMDGNITEARSRYEEAGSIAHAIGFEEGVISANEGLKRLSAPPLKRKSKLWS